MNTRLAVVKTVLWALVGVLVAVTAARFLRGLGATTALSDAAPWGIWIAFDVMSGVALAAGGFVLAATVYIFGGEKYRAFVRPAILTALLGYIAVAVGLLYDLGLPWHIWHPMIYPQHHSVLFEVAMCVMLYLAVLSLEFAPVVLEYRWFDRPFFRAIHKLVHGAVIPLVIAGIVLSTLHQSSLGSLFLITPYRLHPLWYTPIIWILFLVSAVALGLMMVTAESLLSGWLFRHEIKVDRLAGLGRAASVVLFVYAFLRLASAWGHIELAFNGSWLGLLFLVELSVSALIPATLLLFRQVRTSIAGLGVCAGMTIFGMIGYRFNVCIVAFHRPEGTSYFPSWTELAVSLGIVAGATLVFIFFVEKLKVYPEAQCETTEPAAGGLAKTDYHPASMRSLLPNSLSGPRRYSLAMVLAAAATTAFLAAEVFSGTQLPVTPVSAARTLDGWIQEQGDGAGNDVWASHDFSPAEPGSDASPLTLLSIDGNRDGRLVLFPHDRHKAILGEQDSCRKCHHQNMPFDKNTSCCECHRDMYTPTDVFDHDFHIAKLNGNDGCADCHDDRAKWKDRDTATGCVECHEDMTVEGSLVEPPLPEKRKGSAAGYMKAMHHLCITCHQQMVAENPRQYGPEFAECANCHRDSDAALLQQTKGYSISGGDACPREPKP